MYSKNDWSRLPCIIQGGCNVFAKHNHYCFRVLKDHNYQSVFMPPKNLEIYFMFCIALQIELVWAKVMESFLYGKRCLWPYIANWFQLAANWQANKLNSWGICNIVTVTIMLVTYAIISVWAHIRPISGRVKKLSSGNVRVIISVLKYGDRILYLITYPIMKENSLHRRELYSQLNLQSIYGVQEYLVNWKNCIDDTVFTFRVAS